MTFGERLSSAYSALKGIPYQGATNTSIVPMYSSIQSMERAVFGYGQASNKNYSSLVGDLSLSTLVIAAVRWLGNRLPEPLPQVREDVNEQEDDQLISGHPLTQLLLRPNPFFEGSTLWKGIAYSWITADQAFLLKVRSDSKQVVELWYEPHDNVRIVSPRDGSKFISHYEVRRGNTWYPIPAEDMVHFRNGIDPSDTRFALASMPSLFREIYGDNQTADYYAELAGGSGIPPFVATINNKNGTIEITPEDAKAIKAELIKQTKPGHKGEPLVVENLDIKKLAWSPQEMDLRVARYLAEERFCAVTGIPAICLELGSGSEHSIYNNVQQAETRAAQSYLVPLWKHLAEVMTYQLLPDFEKDISKKFVTFDLSKVQALQEDVNEMHTRVGEDYRNGAIDRAEYRAAIGYEVRPEDEGVYFTQSKSQISPDPLNDEFLTAKIARSAYNNGHQ